MSNSWRSVEVMTVWDLLSVNQSASESASQWISQAASQSASQPVRESSIKPASHSSIEADSQPAWDPASHPAREPDSQAESQAASDPASQSLAARHRASLPNDEKFNLCTSFLSVSQCSFSGLLWAEYAISAYSSMVLIKSMILDILEFGLEIFADNHFLIVNSDC